MTDIIAAALRVERAKGLLDLRRYKEAENELRQALACDGARSTSLYWLTVALQHQGRTADAEETAGRCIASSPEWGDGYLIHAWVLRKRGKLPKAEESARAAIRKDPAWTGYKEMLGWILLDQGRLGEALKIAEDGLRERPEHVGCHQVRTSALIRLGRLAEAKESALHAAALNPEDEFSMAQLGNVAFEQKDLAAAEGHFARALRLSPTYTYARDRLQTTLRNQTWVYRKLAHKQNSGMTSRSWFAVFYFGLAGLVGLAIPWPTKILAVAMLVFWAFFCLRLYVRATLMPLSALVMRRGQIGRAALSRDEIRCSDFAAALLLAAGLALLPMFFGFWISGLFALLFALTLIPVSRAFQATGRRRKLIAIYTIVMFAAAACSIAFLAERRRSYARDAFAVSAVFWTLSFRRG